jgi:uncharacterized protein YuzE
MDSKILETTYDKEAKAMYVRMLKDVRIAKSFVIKEGVNLDISEDDKLIGIELLLSNANLASPEVTNVLNKLPA